MKLCPKCAYVFTCRYANTDITNCDKYEHTRLSREEYERQIWIKKQVKEMLEDEKDRS